MKHSKKVHRGLVVTVIALSIVAMLAACGSSSLSRAPSEKNLSHEAGVPAPTMAPSGEIALDKMTRAPAAVPMEGGLVQIQPTQGMPPLPTGPITVPGLQRQIIKNAEISLQVQNTDNAVDGVTGLAAEYNGYIINSRTWYEDSNRLASMTLSVPVDSFEQVLRRLRGLAVKVLSEQATGQDVTDQYVDLQSRQRNLEATAARIRSFLDQATSVKDALEVNQQLSQIEGQIEDVKGKLQYLQARAAYSNISITLEPERGAPTPIPAWTPGQTFTDAGAALLVILRFLANFVIWAAVILLPFLVPLAIIVWLAARWTKGRRQHRAERPIP